MEAKTLLLKQTLNEIKGHLVPELSRSFHKKTKKSPELSRTFHKKTKKSIIMLRNRTKRNLAQ